MQIKERSATFATNSYRYGFNGMEKDNEVKGSGNSLDFGARIYDSRLGRWLATDPLRWKYPSLSTYCFVGNGPLIAIDPNGKEIIYVGTAKQQEDAKAVVLLASNSEGTKKTVEILEASSVKFYILLGTQEEIKQHTTVGEVNLGGVTSFDFNEKTEGVTIGIENANSSLAVQIAAMADELKSGEQFLNEELGFVLLPTGKVGAIGYDPTDELDTKIASSKALTANGFSADDLPDMAVASKTIMKAYEDTEKDENGNISPKDKKSLLKVLYKTEYGRRFAKAGTYRAQVKSAKDGVDDIQNNEMYPKGTKTAIRAKVETEGKTESKTVKADKT